MLVLSWGGTYGACATAVHNAAGQRHAVAHCHLRYLNPFPKDLGDILKRFKKVLVPELNMGQLRMFIRAKFLVDAIGLNKIQGKPFSVAEVDAKIEKIVTARSRSQQERQAQGDHGRSGRRQLINGLAHTGDHTTDTQFNQGITNHEH